MKFQNVVGLGILLGTMATTSATAQTCTDLKGSVITVSTFDHLAKAVPTIAPKDEFETTAQYEARKAAAASSGPSGPVYIEVPHDNDGFIKYNADLGAFEINAGHFKGGYYLTELDNYSGPFDKGSNYRSNLVGVGLTNDIEVTETYTATNGFGAEVEVFKRNVTRHELVEGLKEFSTVEASIWEGSSYETVGVLTVPPAEARDVSPRLRTAVLFSPTAPFYVEHVDVGPSPKRDRPYEDVITTKALVGDLQCAVVYDTADMSVQWAKETR